MAPRVLRDVATGACSNQRWGVGASLFCDDCRMRLTVAKTASMTASATGVRRWPPAMLERPELLGPILVAPAILYIVLLVGYPFLLALYLAMSDANVATVGFGNFVGLDNFVSLF